MIQPTPVEPVPDAPEIADLEYVAVSFNGDVKTFETAGTLATFMWGKQRSQWAIFTRVRWGGGDVAQLRELCVSASQLMDQQCRDAEHG